MITSVAIARRNLVRRCTTTSAAPSSAASISWAPLTRTPPVSSRFQSSSPSDPKNTNNNKNDASSSSSSSSSSLSLFGSAAETYANLRWKFANSLTRSLSKEEQQELLGRLTVTQPKQQPNESDTATDATENIESEEAPIEAKEAQHSIAEAVAAARAQEAQTQKAKWDEEKTKLMAEAEDAARARVENELLIQHRRLAFERWQNDLAKETAAVAVAANTTSISMSIPVVEAEEEKLQPSLAEPNTDSTTIKEEPMSISDHPVLGNALADLGYKRVHIASVAALKSLPVWQKQRTYRHERAKQMASDKMKTLHLGMPGVIALHEDASGKLSIIDGQHRVGMMTILDETKENSSDNAERFFDLNRILVEVYPETTPSEAAASSTSPSAHAQDIFLEINKAEPVKLIDLPGIGITKAGRKTINGAAKNVADTFPSMFSASQRCRPPHVNVDNLRDALFASDVVKRHNLKTIKALEAWIMEQNERLTAEYTVADSKKASSVSKAALAKAIKFDFFLGLDSQWLYA